MAAAVDAVAEVDDTGSIEMINHHAEAMFQVDPSRCVGRPLASMLSKKSASRFTKMLRALVKDQEVQHCRKDMEGKRRDDSTFPLRLSMSRGYLGGRLMFVIFMKDISRWESFFLLSFSSSVVF